MVVQEHCTQEEGRTFQNMTHIKAKASDCVGTPEKQAAGSKDWDRSAALGSLRKSRGTKHLVGMFFPSRRQQGYQAGMSPGRVT